ncbi:MAG: tetratricopeptide repeat protein, partial [Bacteroidales bacterium]
MKKLYIAIVIVALLISAFFIIKPIVVKNNYQQGLAYSDSLNYEKALDYLNSSIKWDKKNIPALIARANAFYHLEKEDAAINDYNKVLAIDSTNFSAWFGRGLVYLNNEDYQNALHDFEKAESIDITTDLLYFLGFTESNLENYQAALDDLNRVIERDSLYAEAYHQRGIVWANLDNLEASVQDFNKALE